MDLSHNGEDEASIIKRGPRICSSLCQFIEHYECENEKHKYERCQRIAEGLDEPTAEFDSSDLERKFKFQAKKYLNQLQCISNGESKTFVLNMQDIEDYASTINTGVDDIIEILACTTSHTSRAVRLIMVAAEQIRRAFCPSLEGTKGLTVAQLVLADTSLPYWIKAPFDVQLVPLNKISVQSIRDINDQTYGRLIRIECIVTKSVTAKPKMAVVRYKCNTCQGDVFQPVEDDNFTPLRLCETEACKLVPRPGSLNLISRECKLVKHETVIVQEPTHHCPSGNVPRQLEIILEDSLTGLLRPGFNCTITGSPFPVDIKGYHSIQASLIRDVGFIGHHVVIHKQMDLFTDNEKHILNMRIREVHEKPNYYAILADSICPTIYGHDDVKKALLMQLVGAPTLNTSAGLSIRGEIHILLMGDPGVAKSQLLGKITKVAPRAQYTVGKGATGVGLTASVTKDPTTGEFSLQGGAIVLADTGICCIDEFDKMEEIDRTAIHEVMEQQTVSVSKAGFNVQLNARTAILAAANPVEGRYDTSKSAVENMRLPYSLISRFDLQFLLLDKVDSEIDGNLAHHILNVHLKGKTEGTGGMDPTTLRYYISHAKTFNPTMGPEVRQEIKTRYVDMRAQERFNQQLDGKENSYTTPRALFSLIRLAQAHARIRFTNEVTMEDVDEACRITESSKASIKVNGSAQSNENVDKQSSIMELLRKFNISKRKLETYEGYIYMTEFEEHILTRGYSIDDVKKTVREYIELGVLQYKSGNEREVAFVD